MKHGRKEFKQTPSYKILQVNMEKLSMKHKHSDPFTCLQYSSRYIHMCYIMFI